MRRYEQARFRRHALRSAASRSGKSMMVDGMTLEELNAAVEQEKRVAPYYAYMAAQNVRINVDEFDLSKHVPLFDGTGRGKSHA